MQNSAIPWKPYSYLGLTTETLTVAREGSVISGGQVYNLDSSDAYVKFYNQRTQVDPSATDPDLRVFVPAGQSVPLPILPGGFIFDTGVSLRATANPADNDTTDPTADTVIVEFNLWEFGPEQYPGALLKEDGGFLLLETGGKILLEV